jgi:hypothetical protein
LQVAVAVAACSKTASEVFTREEEPGDSEDSGGSFARQVLGLG